MGPRLLQSDTSVTDGESGIHEAGSLDGDEDSGSGSSCRGTKALGWQGVGRPEAASSSQLQSLGVAHPCAILPGAVPWFDSGHCFWLWS